MAITSTLVSKLPSVGTTIFTKMSALAVEKGAINLSQGFPDFPPDVRLLERASQAILTGNNQYAPMTGLPLLREAIASVIERHYSRRVSALDEITVTSGASEAIFDAIAAFVHQGDEVVLFDPAYDLYEPAVTLAGGICRRVTLLAPDFRPDWQAFAELLNDKTRLVLINTPHNPTGSCWLAEDVDALWQAIASRDIYVLSDEVYEFIHFGESAVSVHQHAELAKRSLVVSSFGKSFHLTGWKVGYIVAPTALTAELRKVHQFVSFCTATPLQQALAEHLLALPGASAGLAAFYQQKRDVLRNALVASRFTLLPCEGTYFQLLDYSAISDLDDVAFCEWLIDQVGVAAIPVSVFYQQPPKDQRLIRLCFAKEERTLLEAARRLAQL
ncbi:aminotransferase class I/II-fold pyridoxal phosphate-dependent enzyme [Marinomonas sp. M1K-6]|uniref:Aminotransferase class I/II-fold pyridoxal phosphate-dependent enzyme n=1 Tax=Marinomonas profundi TaxID=2726122 RepID=A0A847R2F2_9GAMM|nr:methionine aminotransferase [Marinomonas profundi]NLQ17972.1 aminotransferase class I/II-fold pyridoxal phosphate-dependent enzyme [Marinomonas profundi]UDV01698.1 aminotransferase class I/II-fold pyridoxal phosphate-dependent enzyme [Marinomonas profundi]